MTNSHDSNWRRRFKVHPAADLFPMMSDDELAKIGEDIKANRLKECVDARGLNGNFDENDLEVLDGRNRLEAMERAGIDIEPAEHFNYVYVEDHEVNAYVISKNIQRRHLTPGDIADLVVKLAAIEVKKETGSRDPVSAERGGRGKKSKLKAKAIEIAEAMPEEARPSESTIKRAMSTIKRAMTKIKPVDDQPEPQPKETFGRPLKPKPKVETQHMGIVAARRLHVEEAVNVRVDVEAEIKLFGNDLREAVCQRDGNGAAIMVRT